MIRFHLDEHVDPAIALTLRRRGIDVTIPSEVGLLGASDEQHIAFALGQQRVIYTNDADYLRLAAHGHQHAGIAYCRRNSRPLGQIVARLTLLHALDPPMPGRIEFL